MAAGRHLATVHSLKPDNPFPMEAYSRPSFIPYKYKYSPRAPLSHGEYLFPIVDNWFVRSRFKPLRPLVLFGSSDDRYNSGVEEDELVPRISYPQFKRQLKIWAHNQSLPVAVAGYALYYGFVGFLFGYLWMSFVQVKVPLEGPLIKDAQRLRVVGVRDGDYYLLLLSILTIPLIGARFHAIFLGSTTTISYVLERLGVKMSFAPRELTGGFGVGIILALASGFRRPTTILPVGLFVSLTYGLIAISVKFFDGRPDPFHIEIGENTKVTDGYVTIILKYLFSRIYYFFRMFGKIF